MAYTKKSVILTLCVLALHIGFCNSALSSIVLHSQTVTAGQSATFSCMSSGSGEDPTLTWALRYSNGTAISASLSSSYTGGTENGNDGAITSSVTFFVQSSYVSTDSNAPDVRLYCYGEDNTGTSMSIYTTLRTGTTTTTASLGETCSSSITCSTVNSYCNTNLSPSQCNCNTNYYDSNGVNVADGSCIAKSGLGQTCQAGNDNSCGTTYSVCSSSSPFVCVCGSTFTQSGSICVPNSANLGESCINPSKSCPANAACSTTCQCISGFTASSGTCVADSAGYGQSCINPTRSCPNNAECTNGVCECSSNYVYQSSSGTCISSSAGLGDSCTNPTRQCPTNAVCGTSNQCQCSTGYITSGNTCSIPGLGQSCSTSVGCQTTTSGSTTITLQCVNSVCTCPGNYYQLNVACIQKHGLGQSCSSSVSNSCLDPAANCPSGITNPTCQCNSGYTATSGVCVQDTSSSCPSGTNSPSTVTGVSSPADSTTPNVWVEQTCYTVNLLDTQVMRCKDTKAGNLRAARWIKLPNTPVVASTDSSGGSFINGDRTNPNLTVSSAQASYAGFYVCQLCYANNYVRCTNSSNVQLIVSGTAITASTVTISPSTTPTKGSQVTMSCGTTPVGAATSYIWYKGNAPINGATGATYVIAFVQASNSGSYVCRATNTYGSRDSSAVTLNVLYAPEFSLPGGGTTEVIVHNFDTGDLTLTCDMTGNPAITTYDFYDSSNTLLANTTTNTYTVTSSQGYQTYYCLARNPVGLSNQLSFEVQEPGGTGNVGAATENTGIGTGTIAAIVLGIIFLLLLIIIIIVCCCNYGWCRKREKVEQQPPPPAAKPYIPRTIVSANSTVTRKDIGIMVNGHHDFPVSEYEEPRYTTPRYHLKPAKNAGPIISMYDDGYEQPRAHQLPALDTQYLYADEEPKKRHKKKRKRRHREHREPSPRRHDYEPAEPVNLPPSDEDLVVVPGKQNYFE